MINLSLSFELPTPWAGETFNTEKIGSINYLVGPNGSGKSQFALALFNHLRSTGNSSRLLSTDRLRGMEQSRSIERFIGDHFNDGYPKNEFGYYKKAGTEGAGIDTIMLLEERMDLRIQVEATLSQLFEREILLEWDSGNLMPRMRRRDGGSSYRIDREECHGIKELLVLLTHLYNTDYKYLIVDEPELHLHPQYQAFFMNEVRKMSGDPTEDSRRKVIFLTTHSPFIVDIRSEDDLKSVISFGANDIPRQIVRDSQGVASDRHFTIRLNAHHKQFFFSDNPVFVEGISDAQLVVSLMESSGNSVAGGGSCVIDAGGAEEVNQYVALCRELGKDAHFLYDLDSLFSGNLRSCIGKDETIQGFLMSAGLGDDIAKYCGALDRKITGLIDKVLANKVPTNLRRLREYLSAFGVRAQWDKGQYAKARTAVMTAVSLYRDDLASVAEKEVEDIEGRLRRIVEALRERNIHVLGGGAIERYLPSYSGDPYNLKEESKQRAVASEMKLLSRLMTKSELSDRYGELYDAVAKLRSKGEVDVVPVLRDYLSDYIHELQKTMRNNPCWGKDEIHARMAAAMPAEATVFSIRSLERNGGGGFMATIEIVEMMGQGRRATVVSERTNAGTDEFDIVKC